jgi:hypothetical protein
MYIMKIKGTAKIPDYIQIRDASFTLIAYFRADRPDKALKKVGLEEHKDTIKQIIAELPFGKMRKLALDDGGG